LKVVNPKPGIAAALSTDAQLLALIPKVLMFSSTAEFTGTPVYPYLTFFELINTPALDADDIECESEVTIRIDIWGTLTLSTIAGHIDRIMKTIGYGRNYSTDNDEVLDTGIKIFHKSMSFSGTFTFA
jgi:hypothetical protein